VGKSLDLDGKRFGMLIATNDLKVFPGKTRGVTMRLCHCDCGQDTWVVTTKLQNGHTKSCGCNQRKGRSLAPGRSAHNQILDGYKRGARYRNLVWQLTDDEFDSLTAGNCFYCGQSPSKEKVTRGQNGSFIYNGIDRKDNTQGYIMDNVVTCCHVCNRAKRAMLFDDFVTWLNQLSEYRSTLCVS